MINKDYPYNFKVDAQTREDFEMIMNKSETPCQTEAFELSVRFTATMLRIKGVGFIIKAIMERR